MSTVSGGIEVDLGRGEVSRDGISSEEDCILHGGEASEIVPYEQGTSLPSLEVMLKCLTHLCIATNGDRRTVQKGLVSQPVVVDLVRHVGNVLPGHATI